MFQVGEELGFEAVLGGGCHDLLGQSVPVWNGSLAERHPSALCSAGGGGGGVVVASVVILPRAQSAA